MATLSYGILFTGTAVVDFCLRWAYPEAMAKAGFYHQVCVRCVQSNDQLILL